MTEPRLHRPTFSQSRAAEYLDLDTLQKLTGRPTSDFPRVVVKELLDNALDAAEIARVGLPRVGVKVRTVTSSFWRFTTTVSASPPTW